MAFRKGSGLISLTFLTCPDRQISCRGKTDAEKCIMESARGDGSVSHESSSCVGGMRCDVNYIDYIICGRTG